MKEKQAKKEKVKEMKKIKNNKTLSCLKRIFSLMIFHL